MFQLNNNKSCCNNVSSFMRLSSRHTHTYVFIVSSAVRAIGSTGVVTIALCCNIRNTVFIKTPRRSGNQSHCVVYIARQNLTCQCQCQRDTNSVRDHRLIHSCQFIAYFIAVYKPRPDPSTRHRCFVQNVHETEISLLTVRPTRVSSVTTANYISL